MPIRAIRLEIAKPIGEDWSAVGPLMRTIAKATPKLLNAALDARVAIEVAGRDAVKAAVGPDAKASSADGLAYQAVLRAVDHLRAWGEKKKHSFAQLEIPGAMAAQIARTASQAYARRDQERPRFASERILVRAAETSLDTATRDQRRALREGRDPVTVPPRRIDGLDVSWLADPARPADELLHEARVRAAIPAAVEALPQRLAQVWRWRTDGLELQEIGRRLRVTPARACQLVGEAIERVRLEVGG